MTKFFCDCCGKEVSPVDMRSIKIKFDMPYKKIKHAYYKNKTYELCEDCLEKRVAILEALMKDWA